MCITIVFLHNPNFSRVNKFIWHYIMMISFSPTLFLVSWFLLSRIVPMLNPHNINFVWKCVILSNVNLDIILLFIPRYIYDQLSSSLIGHLSVSKKWDNDMRWVMTYERSKEMRRDYDMRWHMRVPKKWEEIIIWLAGE